MLFSFTYLIYIKIKILLNEEIEQIHEKEIELEKIHNKIQESKNKILELKEAINQEKKLNEFKDKIMKQKLYKFTENYLKENECTVSIPINLESLSKKILNFIGGNNDFSK